MNFVNFTAKVLSYERKLPHLRDFPNKLYSPNDTVGGFLGLGSKNRFWEQIRRLLTYTDAGAKNFSTEFTGSTGWEYEMIMAFVDGEFFYSNPSTSQDYYQVKGTHKLEIKSKQDGKILIDQVWINGEQVGSRRYVGEKEKMTRNERLRTQEYSANFVCHFHSHPRIKIANSDKVKYGFFSTQDIESLRTQDTPLMGLVTDQLWLIGKTQEFMDYVQSEPYFAEIGHDLWLVAQKENDEPLAFRQAASKFFKKYQLPAYVAHIGNSFTRL